MSEFGGLRKRKKTQHALVGLGSGALAAAVAVRRPEFPERDMCKIYFNLKTQYVVEINQGQFCNVDKECMAGSHCEPNASLCTCTTSVSTPYQDICGKIDKTIS